MQRFSLIAGGSGDKDPYRTSLALLAHFDNDYSDKSPNALTLTSSLAGFSTTAKFGSHSLDLQNGVSYNASVTFSSSTPFAFGTGDFTIEGWLYQTVVGGLGLDIFCTEDNSATGIWFGTSNINNRLQMFTNATGLTGTSSVSLNTWHHFAFTRTGGNCRIFLDGNLETTSATLGGTNVSAGSPRIGRTITTGQNNTPGLIDDLRITNGVARYTATFTPPTGPYSNR